MRRCYLLALLLAAAPALAQTPPDQAEIDEVNRLGRLLLAYDQAAWHGTDAVAPYLQSAGDGVAERVHGYVAEPAGDGWRVSFGRLSPDSSALDVFYETRLDSAYGAVGSVAYPEPVARTGFPRDAILALNAARARFVPPVQVQYNTAVLPAPNGEVYVYILPSQPEWDVFYVGADVRYTYSPSTRRITDERRLHSALLTFDMRDPSITSTVSSAVLTSIPTETDVFFALSRRPGLPGQAAHYVMTEDWVFFLDSSGVGGWLAAEAFRRLTSGPEGGTSP